MQQRVLAARFPHLGLITGWRRHPELRGEPVIVGGAPELRLPVIAASASAAAAGVRSGQPLRQAQQLCPAAAFVSLDAGAVARLREQVSAALLGLAPHVEVDDDGAHCDIGGRHAAFADEASWAAALARTLAASLDCDDLRVGVAGSRHVADIAAEIAEPRRIRRIPEGGEAVFLAPLPLHHLALDPATALRLSGYGLDSIGDIASLAAADLQRQLGRPGLELWRRARGEDSTAVTTPGAARRLGERLVLEGGVGDLEALRFAIHRLALDLGGRLCGAGLLAEAVELHCEFEEKPPIGRRLVPPQPLGAPGEIWEIATDLFAGLEIAAPVSAVRLEIEGLHPGPGRQIDLLRGGDAAREQITVAASRLRRRYGAGAVRSPALATDPGDLPERRFRWVETAGVEELSPHMPALKP